METIRLAKISTIEKLRLIRSSLSTTIEEIDSAKKKIRWWVYLRKEKLRVLKAKKNNSSLTKGRFHIKTKHRFTK